MIDIEGVDNKYNFASLPTEDDDPVSVSVTYDMTRSVFEMVSQCWLISDYQ